MTDEISPEAAKQLIDEAPFGFLIVGELTPLPIIGNVSDEDIKVKLTMETYRFE